MINSKILALIGAYSAGIPLNNKTYKKIINFFYLCFGIIFIFLGLFVLFFTNNLYYGVFITIIGASFIISFILSIKNLKINNKILGSIILLLLSITYFLLK